MSFLDPVYQTSGHGVAAEVYRGLEGQGYEVVVRDVRGGPLRALDRALAGQPLPAPLRAYHGRAFRTRRAARRCADQAVQAMAARDAEAA